MACVRCGTMAASGIAIELVAMLADSTWEGARRSRAGELEALALPAVPSGSSWEDATASLFRWVEAAAIATVDWYLSEKRSKARWSRCLRVVAIVFTVMGSLAPFIAVGTDKSIYALWGYPCLAVGAACVGLDRVFGFSSSWMRYQSTVSSIQQMMIRYQLRWGETLSSPESDIKSSFKARIDIVDGFAADLSNMVDKETQHWVDEFRGHVSHLEANASHFQ
jgi:hypothetical protein